MTIGAVTEPVTFFSERCRLAGDLYRPDTHDDPGRLRPGIVSCSGYQGLKDIHPARFARHLAPDGYVCLAFDYRGFGDSEGERGRVVPQDQVDDVHNALSFLAGCPGVDPERLGVIGWGMGGGIAVQVAAQDPRVRALAVCNGIGSGSRTTRAAHNDVSWADLSARIAADQEQRVRTGTSERVHPFTVLPLTGSTRQFVDTDLYPTPGFGTNPVSLESAELLLRFEPELMAHLLAPRPVLVVHGTENDLYAASEAEHVAAAVGPSAELVWLDGSGHTEFMRDEDPVFQRMMTLLIEFFGKQL